MTLKRNARTKQKQQTNGNRAIWLIYRTDTNARGFKLVKRTIRWKNALPENFLEINQYFALTPYCSHCNTIGQLNNVFTILGISWRENEESMFWSFHPLADKTSNKHLPKPLFKVIRKSLYQLPNRMRGHGKTADISPRSGGFNLWENR